MLEFYVNRSLRKVEDVAPGSVLATYRTAPNIIRQVELGLGPVASQNPSAALELADLLWDQGYLEMHLLAAFLLGRIPPAQEQGERLLARLTAWTAQVRDPNVRSALLTTSLARLRTEAPDQFLELIGEWLHPSRTRTWSNGIQALLPMISDPDFNNLPRVLDLIEPVVEAAPALIQLDLQELILALYGTSPGETSYFLRQVLTRSRNPMTSITLRRLLPSFPIELQSDLRDLLRKPGPSSAKGG
jgi:hypothetical protein